MMLTDLTIAEASRQLKDRRISATELIKAHIHAAETLNSHLNAFITLVPDEALQRAKQSDKTLQRREGKSLTGIPIGIKDLFCTKDIRTTAASRMLDNFVPSYESTVTANLLEEGAVFIGKTNLDEFAMGSANITSAYGPVENPWKDKTGNNRILVPGGSSGGSASAIAAGLVMGATGTDTGGSIRQPSAFCGITGIKPTYGRCSRWGIIAFASSLDQAGPMARTVEDCAILLQAMSGFDAKDGTSTNRSVPDFVSACGRGVRGLKVGIPTQYRVNGLDNEITRLWQKGIDWLKEAGCEVVEVELPYTRYGLAVYYVIAPAECSSNLARYDGIRFGYRAPITPNATLDDLYKATRQQGFGAEVKRRILMGTYVLSAGYYDAYYVKAQKVRSLISQDFRQAFTKVDILLTPTAPSAAFAKGDKVDDPVQMYLNDIFTVPASLAGLPCLSVPCGLNFQGLPLGLQLIGRPFDEESLFAAGYVMERAAGFDNRPSLHAEK